MSEFRKLVRRAAEEEDMRLNELPFVIPSWALSRVAESVARAVLEEVKAHGGATANATARHLLFLLDSGNQATAEHSVTTRRSEAP